jgi:hypothetical protein
VRWVYRKIKKKDIPSAETKPEDAGAAKPKQKVSIWTKAFSFLIIVLMASWAIAMYEGKDSADNSQTGTGKPDFEINGFAFFVLQDGSFATYVDVSGAKVPVAFRLDPRNASNISIDDSSVPEILGADKVYIVFNPNQGDLGKVGVAAAEVSRITSLYNIETVASFTEDAKPSNPNVPIRTCADAGNTTTIIYLNVGNETAVKNVDGCVYVTGKDADDMILAADKLGYNLLGIKL